MLRGSGALRLLALELRASLLTARRRRSILARAIMSVFVSRPVIGEAGCRTARVMIAKVMRRIVRMIDSCMEIERRSKV